MLRHLLAVPVTSARLRGLKRQPGPACTVGTGGLPLSPLHTPRGHAQDWPGYGERAKEAPSCGPSRPNLHAQATPSRPWWQDAPRGLQPLTPQPPRITRAGSDPRP